MFKTKLISETRLFFLSFERTDDLSFLLLVVNVSLLILNALKILLCWPGGDIKS